MPTNANTYNSRITSEALEAAFRERFPAQGGAELVDDLYASGVIQPVFDLSTTAAGGALPVNLQTAWDFSTGNVQIRTTTQTNIITNPGFWLVDLTYSGFQGTATALNTNINIFDGSTAKPVWGITAQVGAAGNDYFNSLEARFVVFLRSGDSLRGKCMFTNFDALDVWYRQIADVNGNLVNPLGFTSQ